MTRATTRYTDRKVFYRLAEILGPCTAAEVLHVDRYSVADGQGGLATQVAQHAACYPDDPDVQAYLAIPEEEFRAPHENHSGIRWIAPSDIHHSLSTDRRPTVALVRCGRTMFLRVELSSVSRSVHREDGEDENAYTTLVMATLNHITTLREARWAGDITRFARDSVNAATLTRKLRERAIVMRLNGQPYDLTDASNALVVNVQTAVGSQDDPVRRRKLVGARITRMAAGGAVLAEQQMPYGYRLLRRENGVAVKEGAKGLVPIGDPDVADALQVAYQMHADGDTYAAICRTLAVLEADGKIQRRAGQRYVKTFADALTADSANADYDAAFTVFQSARPDELPTPTPPSEEDIAAYLAGGDPETLFTIPQQWIIARPELLRTGWFLRTLANDIRQRGLVLAGHTPIYRDELDEFGFFAVRGYWGWPTDPVTGEPMERFGIPDETLRRSAARLLRSLRASDRPATGGRAHKRRVRRAIQVIPGWTSDGQAFKVQARHQAHNGTANAVLMSRPTDSQGPWGSRHVIATWTLPALCTSVAEQITDAIGAVLDPGQIAPAGAYVAPGGQHAADVRAGLLARADQADEKAAEADQAAAGSRQMAAMIAISDPDGALAYHQDAQRHAAAAQHARDEATRLRQAAEETEEPTHDADADVSITAYLVAGLIRAAGQGGFGPAGLGEAADTHLTGWRFAPATDTRWVSYEVTLNVPLVDGGVAQLPLTGQVPNVRALRGRQTATDQRVSNRREVAAHLVMRDGLTVDQAVTRLADGDSMTRPSFLIGLLMPWLAEHSVTSRGAKNALADHPVPLVRQCVYAAVTGENVPEVESLAAGQIAWRDLVHRTYTNPDLAWGDAAVPDDMTATARILATLSGGPVTVAELARVMGTPEKTIRHLVVPFKRASGFVRPIYARYTDSRAALAAIPCPHCRDGVCDSPVLLPEVATSGYGVICSTCRRVPHPDWANIVFPPAYLSAWTRTARNGRKGRLRDAAQTVDAPAAQPLDVAHVSR